MFFFITMCVPWESNPQPFALLTQCSTTEPQEHDYISKVPFPSLSSDLRCITGAGVWRIINLINNEAQGLTHADHHALAPVHGHITSVSVNEPLLTLF